MEQSYQNLFFFFLVFEEPIRICCGSLSEEEGQENCGNHVKEGSHNSIYRGKKIKNKSNFIDNMTNFLVFSSCLQ